MKIGVCTIYFVRLNCKFCQTEVKKEAGDELGVCVLNLTIALEKSNSIDYVIKGSCDFMEGSSSLYVAKVKGLVSIDIVEVDIKCLYFIT